jgi:hypothetical protein
MVIVGWVSPIFQIPIWSQDHPGGFVRLDHHTKPWGWSEGEHQASALPVWGINGEDWQEVVDLLYLGVDVSPKMGGENVESDLPNPIEYLGGSISFDILAYCHHDKTRVKKNAINA